MQETEQFELIKSDLEHTIQQMINEKENMELRCQQLEEQNETIQDELNRKDQALQEEQHQKLQA